jgi:hypothetical protein
MPNQPSRWHVRAVLPAELDLAAVREPLHT